MAMPPSNPPISDADVQNFLAYKRFQDAAQRTTEAVQATAQPPVPTVPAPGVARQEPPTAVDAMAQHIRTSPDAYLAGFQAAQALGVTHSQVLGPGAQVGQQLQRQASFNPTPPQVDPNAQRFNVGTQIMTRVQDSPETHAREWERVDKLYRTRGLIHSRIMRATTVAAYAGFTSREDVLRILHDELGDPTTSRFLEEMYLREANSQLPKEGGILVPMMSSDAIVEWLYPYSVLGQLGVTFVTSSSGNLSVPKETSGISASYSFENGVIGQQSPGTLGETAWNTKRLGCEIALPKELLRRAAYDADAIYQRRMGKGMGQKMEYTFINGAGQKGEIVGLENHPEISEVNIGALVDGKNINKFKQKLRKNYVPLEGNVKWLFNEDHEYALQNAMAADVGYEFSREMDEKQTLKGKPYLISQNIQTRSGTGAPSSIYYGDWSEYWVVREGSMEISASDIAAYETANGVKSAWSRHQVVVKNVDYHDMAPMDGRAICRCKDARTTS